MEHRTCLPLISAFLTSVAAAPVAAQSVIDLDAGDRSGRLIAGVLDLDRPVEIEPEAAPPPEDITVVTRAGQPRAPQEIEAMILDVASAYIGHPALRSVDMTGAEWIMFFRANIAVESAFNPDALSQVGAIGLGQLMPDTARILGVDPTDPFENLHGSARYLLAQLERFGSPELALAAYNAGPEAVAAYSGIPPYRETIGHVRRVMALYSLSTGDET